MKICIICGTDVAQQPRVKDSGNQYYCRSCWDERLSAQKASDTQRGLSNGSISAARLPLKRQAPAAEDGRLTANEIRTIAIGCTLGFALVLGLVYFLFIKNIGRSSANTYVSTTAQALPSYAPGTNHYALSTAVPSSNASTSAVAIAHDATPELSASKVPTHSASSAALTPPSSMPADNRSSESNKLLEQGMALTQQSGGNGASNEAATAASFMRQAAALGNPEAMNELGTFYSTGFGVSKDEVQSAQWFKDGANSGSTTAAVNFATCLEHGIGLPEDDARAAAVLRSAADRNNADAMCLLGAAYALGQGLAKDPNEAARWYQKAADVGQLNAMYLLGLAFATGQGETLNLQTAYRWYEQAAAKGHAGAMLAIGNMYYSGHGVPQDYDKALKWFQSATNGGNGEAANNIGGMYGRGIGVAEDAGIALRWFQRANDLGFDLAAKNLDAYRNFIARTMMNYAATLKAEDEYHIVYQQTMQRIQQLQNTGNLDGAELLIRQQQGNIDQNSANLKAETDAQATLAIFYRQDAVSIQQALLQNNQIDDSIKFYIKKLLWDARDK